MSRFISDTAGPSPLITARATIVADIRSTSSGMAATGCTFV